jgi:hypothetical protein
MTDIPNTLVAQLGTVTMAAVSLGANLFGTGYWNTYLFTVSQAKVYSNWGVTFLKAIPCNMLVCIGNCDFPIKHINFCLSAQKLMHVYVSFSL